MQREKKIYIKELFFKIFSSWRTIIIWMIVFAVLANIFFCVKYYRALSAATKQKEQTEEVDISTYRNALSDDDAKDVENNFDMYVKHKSAYDRLMEYCTDSIYMNLDPNSVPTIQMEYSVSNCDFAKDYINLLSSQIQSDNIAQDIIDELNLDISPSYIWELVEFTDAEQDISQSDTTAIIQEESNSLMMIVKVKGESLDSANQMADILNNEILSVTNNLREQYGAVQIEEIGKIESTVLDDTLLIRQQDYSGRINNLKSYLENIKSSMTASQESYYNALIDDYEINNGIQETETQQETEATTETTMQYFNIKYIIAGLFLGAVLACCYICVPYVFGNKFQTPYEVSDCFGITVLGTVEGEKKKKRKNIIDKQINRYFRKDDISGSLKEKMIMIETNIDIICKKKGFRRIFVTSSVQTDKVKMIKAMLLDLEKQKGLELILGESILTSNTSLERLSESEGVVFIEEIASTNLEDINEEVNICKKYDVPIIGMIVGE